MIEGIRGTVACLDEGKRSLDELNFKVAHDRIGEINGIIDKLKHDYSRGELFTVDFMEELFDLMYERKKLQERIR